MPEAPALAALAGVSFAAVALLIQWALAWGGGRPDHSVRAGSPARGVLFNFTAAMSPGHKETARLHLVKFGVGVAMHLGIAAATLKLLYLLAVPDAPPWRSTALGAALLVAAACGLTLLLRRALSAPLRSMSCADDFLSVSLVVAFLALSALEELGLAGRDALLVAAAALFFYLPLGKLRHALFFFVVRADYGRRMGYRGVYPPRRGEAPRNA